MRLSASLTALTVAIALCASSCSVSRKATDKSVEFRVESLASVDSSRVESLVVMDTLREVTTVTVVLRQAQEPNQPDDTIRVTTVTDRTRARETLDVRSKTVDVRMRVDTVYIVKDSTEVLTTLNSPTTLNSKPIYGERVEPTLNYLKWIFIIILGLIALIVTIKIGLRRSLF